MRGHADSRRQGSGRFFLGCDVPSETQFGYNSIPGATARRPRIEGLEGPKLTTFLMLETGRDHPHQAA